MPSKIFSVYDVSLLLLIVQSLMLAINARKYAIDRPDAKGLLSLLYFCFAVFQVNIFLFWSGLSPHIFLYLIVFGIGFVFGPLLHLLVQCCLSAQNGNRAIETADASRGVKLLLSQLFNRRALIHFAPLVIYPFYLVLLYFSLGSKYSNVAPQYFQVLLFDPLHVALMMAMLATQISYSVLAWRAYAVSMNTKSTDAGVGGEEDRIANDIWANIFSFDDSILSSCSAFSLYWIWSILNFVLSLVLAGAEVAFIVGALGNILLFLYFAQISFSKPSQVRVADVTASPIEQRDADTSDEENSKDPYRDDQVERIAKAMEEKQLYLNPELTLEQLAEQAQIPPRLVSTIINRRFNKNFFEFTNSYRVDHAKDLLKKSGRGVSMLDIMADSGFNSKSAFNRFFKKYTEMTPTQYRQAQKK